MEHLEFPFEFEEKGSHTDDDDNPMFQVSGYASTFKNTDLVNDIIEPGAFSKTLAKKGGKNIKILWQHDVTMPIGKVTKIVEDEKGLFIKAALPKDHRMASDVASLIKNGVIDSMSIGFTVNDAEFNKQNKRVLKDIKVHEISFVTFPANPKATVSSFKKYTNFIELPLADLNAPWNLEKASWRIDEFSYYKDDPDKFCNKARIFNKSCEEGSCDPDLLIADIVDGELKAIPKAIFSLVALLKTNKNYEESFRADLAEVKDYISRYYAKMDMAAPFATNKLHSEELECLTKRELEDILHEDRGLCLSKSAATHLISCLSWNRSESDASIKQQDIDYLCQSILNITESLTHG